MRLGQEVQALPRRHRINSLAFKSSHLKTDGALGPLSGDIMKYFRLLFSLAAICAGVQQTVAQTQNDNLIVPGVRIGPAELGMSEVAVFKKFGSTGRESFENNDTIVHLFYSAFIVTIDRQIDKVVQISTSDPRYSTANGIKVGISNLVATKKLGIPTGDCDRRIGCNYWFKGGLWLDVKGDQSIQTISVLPAAQ